MKLKIPLDKDVLTASRERISYVFDHFERIFISFSGGKDSTVCFHLVMDEARKRGRTVRVMLIDFEAQYKLTADHAKEMFSAYSGLIDLHWICLPMKLRNAVSNFEPSWTCWDPERRADWVREMPVHEGVMSDPGHYPWFIPRMEFEEFVVLFGEWYGQGKDTAAFVAIRADESLNRFRTICQFDKIMHGGMRWTTQVIPGLYNVYPIYDWRTSDIWAYHAKTGRPHNRVYDLMHQAGVPLGKQRLCQPYGDDQRRGLWLYHILEPETWYKVVNRVNGANSGACYVQETGNITGYNRVEKPPGHTYRSFCNLLLSTMPKVTRDHFIDRFRKHIRGWKGRGYPDDIPDEAPRVLENKHWVPSWRRLCKVLLRNDWWCKGLGMQQPKSEAYAKYLEIRNKNRKKSIMKTAVEPIIYAKEVEPNQGEEIMTDKQEPSYTFADLQHAVRDINQAFGTKQKHVAKKEQIINFIIEVVGSAFGPDPENEGQTIWIKEEGKSLSAQTIATYEALIDAGHGPKAEPGAEPAAATAEPKPQPETSTAASEPEAASNAENEGAAEPGPEPPAEEQNCPDFGKPLVKKRGKLDEGYDPESPDCQPESCLRAAECAAAVAEAGKADKGGRRKKAGAAQAPAKERYGYVHAAHDAIMEMDASRDDLAKKVLELYTARGNSGDLKQARRNLDTDLRSLLVFGVVKEEGGKIILVNRK